jgi:hypothetical protein
LVIGDRTHLPKSATPLAGSRICLAVCPAANGDALNSIFQRLTLATIAPRLTLLAADLPSAPRLSHADAPFPIQFANLSHRRINVQRRGG